VAARALKIAVNTRLLLENRLEGIGWFAYETLSRLARWHPEVEFVFLFDRPFSQQFVFGPNVRAVVLGPQARHPVLFVAWFELSVARFLDREKPDLFLSPDGFLSLRTRVPSLAVIHDLNFMHRPQDLPWLVRSYYRFFFPRFAAAAARVATVSDYSRQDLVRTFGLEAGRVDVVLNGASASFAPLGPAEREQARAEFAQGQGYFVFVGSLHPRKNVEGMLEAFERFKSESPTPAKLVVVGREMFKTGGIGRLLGRMRHRADVLFTGRLEPDRLRLALGGAEALVFVPFFEGFGIPLLEAMQAGVPVLSSDRTSLPEVAGGAALLVPPDDIGAIARGMAALWHDKALAARLVARGLRRAQDFSWDKTARALWRSVEKALAQGGPAAARP